MSSDDYNRSRSDDRQYPPRNYDGSNEGGRFMGPRGDYRGSRGGDRGRGDGYRGGRGGYDTRSDFGRSRGESDPGRGFFRGGRGRGDFSGSARRGGPCPLAEHDEGTQFPVLTNRFRVKQLISSRIVYKHLVEIENVADPTRNPFMNIKAKVLKVYLQKHGFDSQILAYDTDRCLITTSQLFCEPAEVKMGSVTFSCSVKFQAELDLAEAFSNGTIGNEATPVLDMILHAAASVENERCGRIKFVPRSPANEDLVGLRGVANKFLWKGHVATIQFSQEAKYTQCIGDWNNVSNPYQSATGVQLGCLIQPTSVVAIKYQPLSEYLLYTHKYAVLGENCDGVPQPRIAQLVKGLRAETLYFRQSPEAPASKRTHKIEKIDFTKNARSFSFEHDGKTVTLQEYYRNRYNVELQYPSAPLVQMAPKTKNTFIPVELTHVSHQKFSGVYDDEMRNAVADMMCMDPDSYKRYIEKTVVNVYRDNPVLREFGVEVTMDMARWGAEMLLAPELEFREEMSDRFMTYKTVRDKGAWSMRNKFFLEGSHMERVRILDMTGNYSSPEKPPLYSLLQGLRDQMRKIGMSGDAARVQVHTVQLRELEKYRAEVLSDRKMIGDMVIILIPRKDSVFYNRIKAVFDEITATQVLVADNTPGLSERKDISRGATHLANILSKVNQKLDGINHRISHKWQFNTLSFLWQANPLGLLVVGVALSNPGTGNYGSGKHLPSYSALVASANQDCTQWLHSMRSQPRGSELVAGVGEMLEDVLKQRSQRLKISEWPDRIVFLRVGVSPGRMEEVCFQEVGLISEAYMQNNMKPPSVTIFVCVKNHNTRLWDAENYHVNLGPGTFIAESGVSCSKYPNFFLLSHAGIKGMSRPVRYFVLQDELGMSPPVKKGLGPQLLKFWGSFLYQQCYLYQRCQRAVHIPSPLYYADALAKRAKILASAIFEKGLNLGNSGESDVSSRLSGSSRPVSTISTEKRMDMFKAANAHLRTFTTRINLMFYC